MCGYIFLLVSEQLHNVSNHKKKLHNSHLMPSLHHSITHHPGSLLRKRSTSSPCSIRFDVILLVDGSASIAFVGRRETGDNDYYKNKIYPFLGDLIKKFEVSEEKVHIGILFFGDKDLQKIVNQVGVNFREFFRSFEIN